MTANIKRTSVIIAGLALVAGCSSIGDYSTKAGECYDGEIIDAEFIRSGSFESNVRLTMSLDAGALGRGDDGAWITTSDGLLQAAPVRQIKELTHDPLSLLHFPGGRMRSYLAFAPATDDTMVTVVISLMENEDVEVRILRPASATEEAADEPLFGVFRLVLRENCDGPGPGD